MSVALSVPGAGRPPDPLRLPVPGDVTAPAYKDWLHVNVFHHSSGAVGLVNVSLHGDPRDPRALAVGTALLHVPGAGWSGAVEVLPLTGASLGWSHVALPGIALAVDPRRGTVTASARTAELTADLAGDPLGAGFGVPEPLPFGSGFLSWSVQPRLRLAGALAAGPLRLDLAAASGYHDHNWGRWHWGDDAGWDWAALVTPEPGPVLVLSRATDRAHRGGAWLLTVADGARARMFRGDAVRVRPSGRYARPLRRFPGAVAALQGGRRRPALPQALEIEADDGVDRVTVRVDVRGAAQLVLADPARRGYSYLQELPAVFAATGRLGGEPLSCAGLGIVERLD